MALYLGNQRVTPNMITSVSGVTPSGTKNITDTSLTDVSLYQYAQVSDGNLVAENIKKDVSILGITGTLEATTPVSGTLQITSNGTFDVSDKQYAEVNVAARLSNPKTVTPSAVSQTVLPDQGDDGLSQVTVSGDSNLVAGNIKKDVSIFGVVGTLEGTNDPDAGKLKLGRPAVAIDWDNEVLNVIGNPYYVTPQTNAKYTISIDGVETEVSGYVTSNPTTNNSTIRPNNFYNYQVVGSKLNTLGVGDHIIKCKTKAYSMQNIDSNGFVFDKPVGYIDSDYTDEIIFSKYSCTNNVASLGLDGETSGALNSHKYDAGTLLTYNPSIRYSYNLNPSGNGITDENKPFNIVKMKRAGKSLVTVGYYYSSSFAKVSFTLSEAKEVKVKYQITKSSSTTPSIVIGPMDTNYTSFSYSSKLSNAVVTYNTTTDFEEKEYSFGTLEPGEHFYFVEFYCYGTDYYKQWSASITPVFNEIQTGQYPPADITVTNSNETVATYTYDPYTGEFSIPMTGNITMTATGVDQPILEKLIVTPSTWDVHTSILTWDYPVADVTYHIQTPDGQEYTTTEKQYNLTGKLGEASGDYKQVKIWAVSPDNMSGKTIINLIYNPNNEFFNKHREEKIIKNYSSSNMFEFNYKNDVYILNGYANSEYGPKYNKVLKYNGEAFEDYIALSPTVPSNYFTGTVYFSQIDNLVFISQGSSVYEINIDTKTITNRTDLVPKPYDSNKAFCKAYLKDDTIYWCPNGTYYKLYYCKKDFSDFSEYLSISAPAGLSFNNIKVSTMGTIFPIMSNDSTYILDTATKTLRQVTNSSQPLAVIETDTQYILFNTSDAKYMNKTTLEVTKTITHNRVSYCAKIKDSLNIYAEDRKRKTKIC